MMTQVKEGWLTRHDIRGGQGFEPNHVWRRTPVAVWDYHFSLAVDLSKRFS